MQLCCTIPNNNVTIIYNNLTVGLMGVLFLGGFLVREVSTHGGASVNFGNVDERDNVGACYVYHCSVAMNPSLEHVPGNLRRPACGDNSRSWPLPILWRMGLVKPGLNNFIKHHQSVSTSYHNPHETRFQAMFA